MIYQITFLSDESDSFKRSFDCDPQATFLDLHKAILKSVGYPDDQMTSFFLCDDHWEKEQEVTLVEMESSYDYDNMVMADTTLEQLLHDAHQRLMYVFDPMFERAFFGELKKIVPKQHVEGIKLTESKGKAPKQLKTENLTDNLKTDIDLDTDFYGDSEYDTDELDPEGFGDMNFDDSSLF
ncbi:MAG: hypothetical protein IJ756_09760 [Paludibacteraceae bacterium]|nr:hypothetical protein [Paludibacteraceae bacterium]MBR1787426.1 hypothetical protein [Paludibacteraceae bacterium]